MGVLVMIVLTANNTNTNTNTSTSNGRLNQRRSRMTSLPAAFGLAVWLCKKRGMSDRWEGQRGIDEAAIATNTPPLPSYLQPFERAVKVE